MKQNVIQVDPAKVKVPDFQRGKVSKLINEIAAGLVPEAFLIPLVWKKGNTLYALDGQQRIAAAVLAGHDEITVMVIECSYAKAARVYKLVNKNRKGLTPFEVFVGEVASGDPDAKAVKVLLDEFDVVKVDSVEDIMKAYKYGVLHTVLSLISKGWGVNEPFATCSRNVRALTAWIKDHPTADLESAAQALQTIPPGWLYRQSEQNYHRTGVDRTTSGAKLIDTAYRKQRRGLKVAA